MLTTEIVTTSDGLAGLKDSWNELCGGEPLQSWNWLATWWKHYGSPDRGTDRARGRELHVVAVYDRNAMSHHQLIGIAPWYIDRTRSKVGVILPLGSGEVCTDHVSLICRPERATDVATSVANHLSDHDDTWNCLKLPFADAENPALEDLVTRLDERDCLVSHHMAGNCWVVELPETWDKYVAGLSQSHRRQLRRWRDRILEQGRTRCRPVTNAEELEAGWQILTDLHQRRWISLGQPGCFASERFHDFHRELVSLLLASGQLRMSWIDLDDKPVSAEYHLAGPQTVYTYQSGIDPDRLDDSPGRLQYMTTIARAIEDGYKHLDFLRGDEPYKSHWRATPRPTYNYRIFPNRRLARLRGRMLHAAISLKRFVRERVKPAKH